MQLVTGVSSALIFIVARIAKQPSVAARHVSDSRGVVVLSPSFVKLSCHRRIDRRTESGEPKERDGDARRVTRDQLNWIELDDLHGTQLSDCSKHV